MEAVNKKIEHEFKNIAQIFRALHGKFGDAVAVVLAAGGTAWSGYDLWKAREQLPVELTAMLKQAIHDCQAACRREAIK